MLPLASKNEAAISNTEGSGEGYLYRYRDFVGERSDWVRQIIVYSQIYFSSPNRFNDPFDCQARFQVSNASAFKVNARTRATTLALERSMPRTKRRELARAKVRPDTLLKELTKGTQEAIGRQISVLSLSATDENIMMWSHYAYGHQGVRLQFRVEADRGFFASALPVQYSRDLPVPEFMGDPTDQIDKLLLTKAA